VAACEDAASSLPRPCQDRPVIGRLHHVVLDCPDPYALGGWCLLPRGGPPISMIV